jgi:hypothetical protein
MEGKGFYVVRSKNSKYYAFLFNSKLEAEIEFKEVHSGYETRTEADVECAKLNLNHKH